jgi:hypothetical protein
VRLVERRRPLAIVRELLLGVLVVCLIPAAILLIGAPVALFVRLLLEAARLVLR